MYYTYRRFNKDETHMSDLYIIRKEVESMKFFAQFNQALVGAQVLFDKGELVTYSAIAKTVDIPRGTLASWASAVGSPIHKLVTHYQMQQYQQGMRPKGRPRCAHA